MLRVNMSNQRLITAFCVHGLKLSGPTKRPGEHHNHTLKYRRPRRPGARPRMDLVPFVCSEDPIKMEQEHCKQLVKYYTVLYLDEPKVRKPRTTYSNLESVRATAKAFRIPKSTVADIKKSGYPCNKSVDKGKHNKVGSGRPLQYQSHVDDEILTWILKMRNLQMPIFRGDIQIKAKVGHIGIDGRLTKLQQVSKVLSYITQELHPNDEKLFLQVPASWGEIFQME